jgi:hypothetical protein
VARGRSRASSRCFLADSATQGLEGKLDATGIGLDTIRSHVFPLSHERMLVILRLEVAPTEFGRAHDLQVVLWGPDGQVLQAHRRQIVASGIAGEWYRPHVVSLAVALNNLLFPAEGDYAVRVIIHDLEFAVVPLYVRYGR